MDTIPPLHPRDVVAPLLPALPGAAIATQPAAAVLPLLAPILRQRVLFLSEDDDDGGSHNKDHVAAPWIRLLAYDADKAARLVDVARSARLEPHPVSGEVELDWDSAGTDDGDVAVRYKRLDVETLQALVLLRPLGLVFRLDYCADDSAEGGSGGGFAWRVGEVTTPDEPDAYAVFGGHATLAEAEQAFRATAAASVPEQGRMDDNDDDDNDDDDDYWARYDATPARTPAVKRSPAPPSAGAAGSSAARPQQDGTTADDDAYFALYDSVQPAMDNHDPDEVVEDADAYQAAPALAHHRISVSPPPPPPPATDAAAPAPPRETPGLVHPRPSSASSGRSSGSGAAADSTAPVVDKLEASAARHEQSAFGVKQHVSRSIKSLFLLARAAGIERDEFEQLVQTELEMLALMEE